MTGTAAEAVQQTKIVRVEEVTRSYGSGATEVHALRGVSFTITRGELVALRGRSGAIVATHDNALIELADRVLELKDGKLVS